MTNKNKTEKFITLLAYILFIISISTFPTLLFTKYLRNIKHLFDINKEQGIQITDIENSLLFISVTILFVILPIILIKITEYKKKGIYSLFGVTLALCVFILGTLIQNKGEINNRIAICIYLSFCIIVWVLSESIRAIYRWLWTSKVELKGKKITIKKELDVKKIALIWAVLSTIVGLLFGIKK